MNITLKNISDFDSEHIKKIPKDFAEAFELQLMRTSFDDKGVAGFKEVVDISRISFGHFMILEKILSLDMPQEDRLKQIAPYLIRPITEPYLDNEDEDSEKEHRDEVEDLPIGSIYGVFNRFIKIRNDYLFKTYNGVIYGTLEEDKDYDNEEDDDIVDGTSVSARQLYNKKFFWYNLVGAVCNGDIFRRQDAVELPMYEVMPFLAEKKNLAIVEYLEAKAKR